MVVMVAVLVVVVVGGCAYGDFFVVMLGVVVYIWEESVRI